MFRNFVSAENCLSLNTYSDVKGDTNRIEKFDTLDEAVLKTEEAKSSLDGGAGGCFYD